jgi:hypothetical protein
MRMLIIFSFLHRHGQVAVRFVKEKSPAAAGLSRH